MSHNLGQLARSFQPSVDTCSGPAGARVSHECRGHCTVPHYSIQVVCNGKLPLTLISMVWQVRGSFPGVAIDQAQVRGSCPDL